MAKPKLTSIERLVFGHNLVSNTFPRKTKLDSFNTLDSSIPKEIEKFGLFESATPNFATYYPGVNAEDLQPKDEDFVYPIFRALSQVIVRPMAPIDFGVNDALYESRNKLVGQTVFPNHEALIGNELGVVLDIEWQDSYKIGEKKIPAGINSRFKLDGKSHPQIARAVMMDPPSIHSTSVTVEFTWEKSHDMPNDEFYHKLGTFDANGQLIKRNVTKVLNYHEISLVPHGADAFAQRVDKNGKIVNPEYATSVYKFNADDEPGKDTKLHFFSYKEDLNLIESLKSDNSTIPNQHNNNTENNKTENQNHMKDLLIKLALVAGLVQADIENLSEEAIQEKLNGRVGDLLKNSNEVPDLKNKITQLQSDLDAKTEELATAKGFEEMAKVGKDALDETRSEATRLYTLSLKGAAPDNSVIELISKANFDTSKVLLKQYAKQAEDAISLSCKDCGSHNVSRLSGQTGDGTTPPDPNKPKSNDAVMDTLQKEFNKINYLGQK